MYVLIQVFILTVFVLAVVFIFGVIAIVKRKLKKELKIKSNLITVGLAYLILASIFYFIDDYGKAFSFFFLPILAIFTLIILEVVDIFKKSKSS
jgi:hypothetical protein